MVIVGKAERIRKGGEIAIMDFEAFSHAQRSRPEGQPIMRTSLLPVIVWLATVCPAQEKAPNKVAALAAGLTSDEVRAKLGPPNRISRQILAHRVREQWHYDQPIGLRLEFDSPRGQVPRLRGTTERRAP